MVVPRPLELRRRRELPGEPLPGGEGDFPVVEYPLTEADSPIEAVERVNEDQLPYHIIAFAASAGGLAALTHVLSSLPADFPTPIVIVHHLDPRHRSLIAEILTRRTKLQVVEAREGDHLRAHAVFVAPPDYHLLVNPDGTLSLSHSELVHFLRPSADLLFESVAAAFRERAIAVILSGTGADGAMGLRAIKKMGGTVIAQDETTSEFFGMPSAAIKTKLVDFVLPLDQIAQALVTLVGGAPR